MGVKYLASALRREVLHRTRYARRTPPRVFYCHVPKCAGSSIATQIRRRLYSDRKVGVFHVDLRASQISAHVTGEDMMRAREIVLSYNLAQPRNHFGTGHTHCPPRVVAYFHDDWDFLTVLRHPVDRWISEFVYNTHKESDWARNDIPIEDYLESDKGRITGGLFVRYFSSLPHDHRGGLDEFVDEAVENLARFRIVGVLEDLVSFRKSFQSRYAVEIAIPRTNTSPKMDAATEIRSDPALVSRIEALCMPDLQVYERVVGKTGTPPSSARRG